MHQSRLDSATVAAKRELGKELMEHFLQPQFLPFSVSSKSSKSTKLLCLYLKMPLAWRLFGRQTFMVGVKT
jgi:hypothetical protein